MRGHKTGLATLFGTPAICSL